MTIYYVEETQSTIYCPTLEEAEQVFEATKQKVETMIVEYLVSTDAEDDYPSVTLYESFIPITPVEALFEVLKFGSIVTKVDRTLKEWTYSE